jgi:hypothetical protein
MYPENTKTGTLVATLDAADPDAGDTRSSLLFLVGQVRKTGLSSAADKCNPGGAVLPSNSWVSVDPTGELRALVPVNFEDDITWGALPALRTFCVDIKVQDRGGQNNQQGHGRYQSIAVTVTDVNEAPTLDASQTFSVLENANGGTQLKVSSGDSDNGKVLRVRASDQDTGNVIEISITDGEMYAGVAQFSVGRTDRFLTVGANAKLNFELKSSYTLAVNVTDSKLFVEGSVMVHLTDINEAPVVQTGMAFSISEHNSGLSTCTLATYCLPGNVVGTAIADDEDNLAGIPETFTFSLKASSNTGSTFAIDSTSGVITVATLSTNLATSGHVFNLEVIATDSRLKASLPAVVKVTVVEKNFSPDFTPASTITMTPLPEVITTGIDLVVGTLEVVDPDKDYPLALSIKATIPPGFVSSFYLTPKDTASSNTKWDLVANAADDFDYETNPSHKICVVLDVVDSKGATSTYSDYCATITDINEAPTLTTQTFKADEGAITTQLKLGSLTATDPDAADDAGLTLDILPSSIAGGSPFTVTQTSTTRPFTWDVFLKPPGLNYETLKTDYGDNFNVATGRITCKVTLKDTANPKVPYEFAIEVTDVNEPPVIAVNALSIAEGASVGAALGAAITVTDPDAVKRDMTFSIVQESPDQVSPAMVSVDSVGGNAVLKLKESGWLDFENRSSYDIVLLADDGGNGNVLQPAKQAKATLTLTVTNVNDVVVSDVKYKVSATTGHEGIGGDTVVISGSNFGPTNYKMSKEGALEAPLVVKYGAAKTVNDVTVYDDFTATSCVTKGGNTVIECTTQALDKQVKQERSRVTIYERYIHAYMWACVVCEIVCSADDVPVVRVRNNLYCTRVLTKHSPLVLFV